MSLPADFRKDIGILIKEKVSKKRNGCWEWLGGKGGLYGSISTSGNPRVRVTAHRYFYTKLVRVPKKGLQVDHLCKNRMCVNPNHLREATPRENVLDSNSISAINHRKTHCKRGHILKGKHVWIHNGKRFCRTCSNMMRRVRRKKKKEGTWDASKTTRHQSS